MGNNKKKKYKCCSAFNCLASNRDTNLSFFYLPQDVERRRQWLTAIGREDLLSKDNLKPTSYVVCASHFKKSDFVYIPRLRDNALPAISVHEQYDKNTFLVDVPTQTETEIEITTKKNVNNVTTSSSETQTESIKLQQEETQTSTSLPAKTQRKRKLSNELRKKIKIILL
ncbi:unnamed protein product [Leptidea sinapis]|uniref:THAP-type domain-containing protein n=1 Tax=Leptidea sinapis TaxID=189913 RepID=A0A5E4R0G4_9NEOP|nr:unnamed protein product [Leptidea sinapis]